MTSSYSCDRRWPIADAQCAPPRAALTVIELLVGIAIVGLLAAVVVPAIQSVRETTRSTQCGSNLKQLGTALGAFESQNGYYPTTGHLPNPLSRFIEGNLDVLRCPSDHRDEISRAHFEYSFLLNDGTRFRTRGKNGFAYGRPISPPIVFDPRDTRVADFTDGLAYTACASERLVTTPDDVRLSAEELQRDPLRFLWYIAERQPDEDGLTQRCLGSGRTTPHPIEVFPTREWGCGYSHILPPNRSGCYNNVAGSGAGSFRAAITATSEHRGFVNLLVGDGRVTSVSSGIDLGVWRAVGTRDGAEPLGQF